MTTAIEPIVEEYEREAQDLRNDDATRRGYLFAIRLVRAAVYDLETRIIGLEAMLCDSEAELTAVKARAAGLERKLAGCQWYWPEDDTSSETCVFDPFEALEYVDPGEVLAVSRGGVVETRYYACLPASQEADSDDDFCVDEATCAEAEAKVKAELDRRADLGCSNAA